MKPARFLAESSFALLARRLRLLGYDVAVRPGATVEGLYEAARDEGRIVLTPSARHPKRYADVAALVMPREDAARAVRTVVEHYAAATAPFTRCTECNAMLVRRSARAASGHVPAAIVRERSELMHCPGCDRWYWIGSHVDRLCAWLQEALGRPVTPPR